MKDCMPGCGRSFKKLGRTWSWRRPSIAGFRKGTLIPYDLCFTHIVTSNIPSYLISVLSLIELRRPFCVCCLIPVSVASNIASRTDKDTTMEEWSSQAQELSQTRQTQRKIEL
jgi:hypothetical protein